MTFEELIENISQEVKSDFYYDSDVDAELVVDIFKDKLIDNKDNFQEVKHGTWEHTNDGAARCTSCKRKMNPYVYGYAFCPLCGARMDGERI